MKSEDAINLPIPLTSFVGREKEIAEIRQRFDSARLLTLTGIGGGGKTRLALQLRYGLPFIPDLPRAESDGHHLPAPWKTANFIQALCSSPVKSDHVPLNRARRMTIRTECPKSQRFFPKGKGHPPRDFGKSIL